MPTPRCKRCSRPVVEISMTVDADLVVMRSCNTCGRSWFRGDQPLALADVTRALVSARSA